MKRLVDDQRRTLSDELRREIVADLGEHMRNAPPMYSYETELPWEKHDILFALVFSLVGTEVTREQEAAIGGIMWLFDVLPNAEQYQSRVKSGEKMRAVNNDVSRGLSTEEIMKKYKHKKW